jgi:methyl acetate hydrolase
VPAVSPGLASTTLTWIDPKTRIAAVFMTQVLPFADDRVLGVYRRFERGIYAAIKAGYVKAN